MNAPDERHLWDYFQFSPEDECIQFHEQSPGHYEQVLVRCPEDPQAAVFSMFPEMNEYRTSDLMERHPDTTRFPNHYKFTGRTDDLIAFANAAKFSPLAYEEQVMGNKVVRSAIMVGIQRPCAALLIELANPDMPSDEALEAIWPTIHEANGAAPKHALVKKEMVIMGSPSKPFERASKETVLRGRTLKLYEREIDAVYDQFGENWQRSN